MFVDEEGRENGRMALDEVGNVDKGEVVQGLKVCCESGGFTLRATWTY